MAFTKPVPNLSADIVPTAILASVTAPSLIAAVTTLPAAIFEAVIAPSLILDVTTLPAAITFCVTTPSANLVLALTAPAAISVISKREIRRESNTNLGDYLKGTKGIDFTQSGIDSYNMTARGFNSSFSSRLLTLTDGRMANVPSLRLTAYNVIPVSFEDVEQIEVVLGPSSALYGPNAHSGVLNIVTSSPLRSTGTSINIQGGLLNQTDTDCLLYTSPSPRD